MSKLFVFLLTFVSIEMVAMAGECGTCKSKEPQRFLWYASYEDCEGKDSANYTLLSEGNMNDDCSGPCAQSSNQLISCGPSGQRGVDLLQTLAVSQYPAGAYRQIEQLFLGTGGPLTGKYLYQKVIFLTAAYLKKCSSILGYSYVSSKSATLLINDKLDLQVLISPTGGFEAFKRGCTTVCRGKMYLF